MKKVGIGVVVLIALGIGAFFFLSKSNVIPLPEKAVVPTIEEKDTEAIPDVNISDLQAGGHSYRNAENVYTFLYPADYILDESDPLHIRIYKNGSTQQGQTEMYDGALVVFEVIALEGETLSDWVDAYITTITASGTSELIEPKKAVTLKEYAGFQYTTRGLGESTNYIFQKSTDATYAVLISTAVYDPGNIGFQNDIYKIISTLELLQ